MQAVLLYGCCRCIKIAVLRNPMPSITKANASDLFIYSFGFSRAPLLQVAQQLLYTRDDHVVRGPLQGFQLGTVAHMPCHLM